MCIEDGKFVCYHFFGKWLLHIDLARWFWTALISHTWTRHHCLDGNRANWVPEWGQPLAFLLHQENYSIFPAELCSLRVQVCSHSWDLLILTWMSCNLLARCPECVSFFSVSSIINGVVFLVQWGGKQIHTVVAPCWSTIAPSCMQLQIRSADSYVLDQRLCGARRSVSHYPCNSSWIWLIFVFLHGSPR